LGEKFQIGDVVQIKSGGPRMTVSSPQDTYGYNGHESVHCVWFNGSTRLEELFAAASLEKVASPK